MSAVNASNMARIYLHNAQYEMNEGDTIVLINMPPWTLVEPIDCLGHTWTSLHVKMHSDKIRLLGSPKFNRKLKKLPINPQAGKYGVSTEELVGVSYVMDLTPSIEGEEMVYEMAELSLTPGIISWWRSQDTFEVDPAAVDGHDDVCHCSKRPPHFEVSQDQFNIWSGAPDYRKIPDYCPIRHRISILRLLYIIEGKHVLLDSAPRVWTMIAIAKIFNCTALLVKPVAKWLSTWRNSTFLEVLPEEGLEIGMTFKFIDITIFTFELLVCEKGLKDAGVGDASSGTHNLTVFGRKSRKPGDDLDNMIQHAAQSLVQRTSGMIAVFESDTIFDDLKIPEWKRLDEVRRRLAAEKDSPVCSKAVEALDRLKHAVFEYWRQNILKRSLGDLTEHECYETDEFRRRYVPSRNFELLGNVYRRMSHVQKALCLFFYDRIGTIARAAPWQTGPDSPQSPYLTFRQKHIGALALALKLAFKEVNDNKPSVFADFDRDPETGAAAYSPFRLLRFEVEVFNVLSDFAKVPYDEFLDIEKKRSPERLLTNHILAHLGPDELKFLPVWAGGQDDGTGRVFNDELPPAEDGSDARFEGGAGFVSPSVASMSVVGGFRGLELESCLASETTSMNVHKDGSTIYNPGRVIADDVSMHSEAFTETGDDYDAARWEA